MASRMQEKYIKEVVPALKKQFGYPNTLAVPRILKVSVNCGVGKIRDDKEQQEVVKYLTMITGQKPVPCVAKKAIATFKTRLGMVLGYRVTLRGERMYDFLERMVQSAIPRMRDFHGLNASIDQGGAFTIGIREHIIFPETINEEVHTIFGFEVTMVTNAKSKEEAKALLTLLGFPLYHG